MSLPAPTVLRLAALVFVFALGCAPLPPVIPAPPVTVVEEKSPLPERDSSLAEDPVASPRWTPPPHRLAPPSSAKATPPTASPVPQSAPPPALPAWQDPLPGFSSPAAQSRNSVVDMPRPAAVARPLRVGLSTDKRRHILTATQAAILVLDGDQSQRVQGRIEVESVGGVLQIRVPDGRRLQARSGMVEMVPWDENSHLALDGKPYRGRLEIQGQGNSLRAVNIVEVEDYLKGVVPHEIGRLDSTGMQALMAQAVAARTYAYSHYDSRRSQGFDVYADTRDQVYEGKGGEHEPANRAITATAGVVLQYQGQLIHAYYFSTSGGHTESMETWGKAAIPYLPAQPDLDSLGEPWSKASSLNQWQWSWSRAQLNAVVRRHAASARPDTIFPFQRVERMFIADRLPGGRARNLIVVTDRGTFSVSGDRTRWLLRQSPQSDRILPSAWFELEMRADSLIARGRGFGHGIGMCQMGARARSIAGISWREILLHYYRGTQLVRYR